jgi:hypothetical protein
MDELNLLKYEPVFKISRIAFCLKMLLILIAFMVELWSEQRWYNFHGYFCQFSFIFQFLALSIMLQFRQEMSCHLR